MDVPVALSPPFADLPVLVERPGSQTTPLVFTSPHSGSDYPASFVAASRLDRMGLRRSEDSFVDELFGAAALYGAPMVRAMFPRAWCDVNREPWELDPAMFADALPSWVNTTSARVTSGLGTIARVVASGETIYRDKITFADAEQRVALCWQPFHDMVAALVQGTKAVFGQCVLIDCHSMPSFGSVTPGLGTPGLGAPGVGADRVGVPRLGAPRPGALRPGAPARGRGERSVDIILGDVHGTSCAPYITRFVERRLIDLGYRVRRNDPYAGGYITRHYGRPRERVHALQIEIARDLYMDESRFERLDRFDEIRADISALIESLASRAMSLETD